MLNYETHPSLKICIKSTDNGGNSKIANFTISISNINEPATIISLLPGWIHYVPDGFPAGSRVGSLQCDDPDIGDVCTFTLPSGIGDDNNLFRIEGSEIYTTEILHLPAGQSYTIHVLARDKNDLGPEAQEFHLVVRDLNDTHMPLVYR